MLKGISCLYRQRGLWVKNVKNLTVLSLEMRGRFAWEDLRVWSCKINFPLYKLLHAHPEMECQLNSAHTHTHTSMLEWHECLQSKLCQSQTFLVEVYHRNPWWFCAHAGKPHSCLLWGKPIQTPTHHAAPGSWLDWTENTGTYQCKTSPCNFTVLFLMTS